MKWALTKRLIENESIPYAFYKVGESFTGASKLLLKNMKIIEDVEGKKELHIELDKYQMSIERVNIKDKYKNKVKEILSKDSLALMDFIGIDLDYDGKTPIISWQDYRKDDKLVINSKIKIKDKNFKKDQKIFIICIDVFGFQYEAVFKINDEGVLICQEN